MGGGEFASKRIFAQKVSSLRKKIAVSICVGIIRWLDENRSIENSNMSGNYNSAR